MKVSNLLSASAWREGVLTSTISERTETESFPGAYVFPPIKGLENRRPVTGLDFGSLYPSLIMTYNLSPDKIILSRKHAEFLRDSGKTLHEINFKFNGIDVLAWSIRHNNIPEEKGLYAIVLEYLSVKRVEIKKRLAPVKEKKEVMELVIGLMDKDLSLPEAIEHVLAKAKEKNHASLNKNLYHFINKEKHEFMAEYDSVCFEYSCLDAGQNAIKVYMNSFYGTAGDKECFQECDELYDYGNGIPKEEYWSRMVEISMGEIEKLRDDVNDFLKADNGSPYLKMAYEEVLFPVVFTGKKKYYGIPHESKPNFNKKPFIRGVEIVKRGHSTLFRKIGKHIMDESMRLENSRTMHQIIKDVLRGSVKDISRTDLNDLIKTAVWKPDKDNKSVQRFMSRMRDRHTREEADAKQLIKKGLTPEPYLYEIPELGERFEFVVVENDLSQKVGDKMEYPEVAKQLGKKIDISYYLNSVVSLCARFINYEDIYQPSPEAVLEALKKLKDANKAKHNGVSGDDKADASVADEDNLDEEDEDEIDEDEVLKIRDALAQKSAEKWVRGTYADKIVKYSGNDVYWSSYLNALDKQEESIRLKLTTLLAEISKIDVGCRDRMYKLVTKPGKRKPKAMTLEKYILAYIQENECALLADLRSIWYKMVGLETTRYRMLSKLQDDKKDNSSEADIDDIIELYC
ncbi:unnamed protein product [Rhizophagus irregularis]|uniref:DNA-directed DNA polymerase n=1 Tax=Rhizophagus irregularis TaxID=588596 RepID=A0A916EHD4_9GLOM|nr:unnamed protein product [Rhizophagus irregularis]